MRTLALQVPDAYLVTLLSFSFTAVVALLAWMVRRLISLGEAIASLVAVVKGMQENVLEDRTSSHSLASEVRDVSRQVASLTALHSSLEGRVVRVEETVHREHGT